MIDGHSVLGVILACGGSEGLPCKNVRDLAGKPLIAWTIEAGHESEYLDRLILSSDDEEIMKIGRDYDCEVTFQRPSKLAQDDTPSMDALLHEIEQVESQNYVVLLQPTSPIWTADDIDATNAHCHQNDGKPCVTVTKTGKPPQWMYTLEEKNRVESVMDRDERITRRQEAPTTFIRNGAVYLAATAWLRD
ncbi:cytidylyltransferase domain-containing protein [Salinibacter ruber]|uniref:acylneuraminate cytidylyltransferase family protein n=1 Tax=Salinibacter ruber TaxID=146919 RepID=UPI002167A2FF|nr:acylneuraminate cytidylyltransferase family protein [Salinibacter ruber]MCS4039524.1 N-acylneuraminate cytidylyltransferase [Salinibacter ruber]